MPVPLRVKYRVVISCVDGVSWYACGGDRAAVRRFVDSHVHAGCRVELYRYTDQDSKPHLIHPVNVAKELEP